MSDEKRDYMLPEYVTTEDACGSRDVPAFTQHLSKGRLYLVGTIDQEMAMHFTSAAQLLADEKQDMTVFINSQGGDVSAGFLIYDVLQAYPYSVTIYCTGLAASMAAIILAGGQQGKRFILPHSNVMIHEPLIRNGFGGSATSIEKTAQNILEVKSVLNGILARHTGKPIEEIDKAAQTDNYMTPEEAVAFGICDSIRNFF